MRETTVVREILRAYSLPFEAPRTGPIHVREESRDCLPIPRLAELRDRAPTAAEAGHLEQCALCRRVVEALIDEWEAVELPPELFVRVRSDKAVAKADRSDDKVQLFGKLDDGRSIEIFSGTAADTLSIRIYGAPLAGPGYLRVSGRLVRVIDGFDQGFGRIRRADLPRQSPDSLHRGDLSVILGDVGDR
jgi:hypothetical protein